MLALWMSSGSGVAAQVVNDAYTFRLHGGHFYGPGPIVPDTALPDGRLSHIRFDLHTWHGYCEFANDGKVGSLLSDGSTRINQNIEAGRLKVGGESAAPILLTAVDGGPHHGREEYQLDERYRMVWRVDIALDSGFSEGIIRLNDFVLTTGIARITRSQQTDRGEPGGYDQAGTLPAGTFIMGRLGDFDQDGFLDGVLVAAPNVPMEADMLPGAPVGNQRGFRTDVPITAGISLELVLRGMLDFRSPIDTLVSEGDYEQLARIAGELQERTQTARANLVRALSDTSWSSARNEKETTRARADFDTAAQSLEHLLNALDASGRNAIKSEVSAANRAAFLSVEQLVADIARINDQSPSTLPRLIITHQAEGAITTPREQ
jgi:hypothetical protein